MLCERFWQHTANFGLCSLTSVLFMAALVIKLFISGQKTILAFIRKSKTIHLTSFGQGGQPTFFPSLICLMAPLIRTVICRWWTSYSLELRVIGIFHQDAFCIGSLQTLKLSFPKPLHWWWIRKCSCQIPLTRNPDLTILDNSLWDLAKKEVWKWWYVNNYQLNDGVHATFEKITSDVLHFKADGQMNMATNKTLLWEWRGATLF